MVPSPLWADVTGSEADGSRVQGADETELADVLDEYPVSLALAFGSRTRGEAFDFSDLDVAVRFGVDHPDRERFRDLDRIAAELEDVADVGEVDVVDLDRIGPHRAYKALREGILLVGSEEDRNEAEAEAMLRKLDFDRMRKVWQRGLSDRIEGGEYGRA